MAQRDVQEVRQQYEAITTLYDLAEQLAVSVEHPSIRNPGEQLEAIEPLVEEIAESADILSEEYLLLQDSDKHSKNVSGKIEKALRRIFTALEAYMERVGEMKKEYVSAWREVLSPALEKIRKQAEKIMLIFMQLVELSVERIMRKHELDQFRLDNSTLIFNLSQHAH